MANARTKPRSLEVAFWNANGLHEKRYQLQEFAERHDVDVVLVNETHLRAALVPKIANYNLYRNDRQGRPGGGTAIYVKRSLEHYVVDAGDLINLEATSVVIVTSSAGDVRLSAVYNPPNRQLLEEDLDTLLSANTPTVLAGDLNAKHRSWHSRRSNAAGVALREFADNRRDDVVIDGPVEPTHHCANGVPDVLDIAIFKEVPLQHTLKTVNDLDSDHDPVLLSLGVEPRDAETITRRTTCWPAFAQHLQETLPSFRPILSVRQLENAVETLTLSIKESLASATSVRREERRPTVLPTELRELIREKNRARRRYQRTWHPDDRVVWNRLATEVRYGLQNRRNESWEAKLESLEEEQHSLWRMARILRNKHTPVPPLHGERGMAYTDLDKVEAFADSLELQFTENLEHADEDHHRRVTARIERELRSDDGPIKPASPAELREMIKRLKERKAPGPDEVPNRALKELPARAIAVLTAVVNGMLRLRHFPASWKRADVILLPKPGQNGTFPQNYRPISLLSTLGKLAEGVILRRLQSQVDDLEVIQDEQFGFRARHSTVHQVLRIVEYVAEGFNKKQSTGAIFLDVSKAFDKVWHRGLLFKMQEFPN